MVRELPCIYLTIIKQKIFPAGPALRQFITTNRWEGVWSDKERRELACVSRKTLIMMVAITSARLEYTLHIKTAADAVVYDQCRHPMV